MSAIGDYVHLTAAGYYRHGTKRFDKNESNYNQVPKIFQNQKSSLRKKMEAKKSNELLSSQEQIELSEALELLMRPSGSQQQIEELNRIWQAMLGEFSKEFNDSLGDIQRQCANVFADSALGNTQNFLKMIDTKVKKDQSTRQIKLQTILKRIKTIQHLMANAEKTPKLEVLKNQIDEIYENLAVASNQSEEALRDTGYNLGDDNVQLSPNIEMSNLLLTEQQYGGVVSALNKIIARTSGSANLQKGTLFQYMIAVAPLVCKKTTVDNLEDFLKTSVVGTTGKSSVSIDSSRFFEGVKLGDILKNYQQKVNDHFYVSNSVSQDKVDVMLQWNEKTIPISAKNINMRSGKNIHLVSGASLLAMVADLDQNYMNHFLNITAQHNFSKDTKIIQPNLLNQAHISLKEILMLEALQGYKTNAQQADFFVVNDNTTGKVKIYSIAQLVLDALDKIDNFVQVTTNGETPIENIRFANDFALKDYSARITKLVGNVHAQKISVSLNPNML